MMNALSIAERENNRQIAIWLLAMAGLIFCMVVLGGVTRLTYSGLSMVTWEPIVGAIPPLTTEQWQETFDEYKKSPEYIKVNAGLGMGVEEFKSIFWFEFSHRLLGRMIGLAFLLPFLYFLFRGKISRGLAPKLGTIFVLGGLQGALGWYMVASGLVDVPLVSHYRLTAHLSAAVIIYGYILWVAFGLLRPQADGARGGDAGFFRTLSLAITTLVCVMIVSGGFVAGLRAGFAFNTFPLMGDSFFPEGLFDIQPFYLNFFDNIATVQLTHRLLAYTLTALVVLLWFRSRSAALSEHALKAITVLLAALALQITLGISTLLLVVPTAIAAAHQGGALVLFSTALYVTYTLRQPARVSMQARFATR